MARIIDGSSLLERNPGLREVLASLESDGSSLWKVRSPSKWFQRKYILDIENLALRYDTTDNYKYYYCYQKQKPSIELEDIIDVRRGWKTDVFNAVGAKEDRRSSKKPGYKPKVEERACFSIVYGSRQETLDLVAPSVEVADKWVRALQLLIAAQKSAAQEKSYELWLRKQYNLADEDRNRCLTFAETMRLMKNLNIVMDEERAKELFAAANVTKTAATKGPEVLDEDEFVDFYFKLLQRPELESLFSRYAPGGFMSANELCQFLQKEQGQEYETLTVSDAKELINVYEPSSPGKKEGHLSLAGFTSMLLSKSFEAFNPKRRMVHQDMTMPMTNYFIASSHNTYLIGNQLSGASSVEGYIDAFKRGCRVVELDCWDGDGDEPIIYHGYTLTTKILFKEVLADAVKPYAFATSQYPVILGLENHCSEPFQKKMVDHLKRILGDMLYSIDLDGDMAALPSPDELKYKVIVRGKKRAPPGSKSVPDGPMERGEGGVKGIDDGLLDKPETNTEVAYDSEDSDSADDDIDYIDGQAKAPKKQGLSDELSALVNILQGTHFNSFEHAKANGKPFQSSSIAESKATKLLQDQPLDFVEYNRRHVTKVYPAGSRTTSSNFNPIPFWTAGCQLVTLNYQTEDMPNFYNYVLFSDNGHCGYVLKPEILRNPGIAFNPINVDSSRAVTLTVRIISGQHIPKAPGKTEVVDPYVELKVKGVIQDRSKFTTTVVHNNGFNPIWDQRFQMVLRCPDLAMVFFRVYDYSQTGTDATLAHYGLPFSCLTPGYRHIHLTSLRGTPLTPASLFVHIKIEKNVK